MMKLKNLQEFKIILIFKMKINKYKLKNKEIKLII